ncbi:glycosyltransferase family 4 protein [Paenibacillus validus]|uniref:Glycosyltransferase n=1 Tax=Paenibacillus validus TaxID=44253 RepID=A0A7X2ZAT3_9BACL|nr:MULTISPECIES: glycosyltransferase family 4 protein [Paenibacillus]MED4601675.1 glycosyltransferase family 4 protein [Paenibacillus validus]MED4606214.1 glycosyltransferase family 4 protein [Paenibacillus validus]MUG70823.1 glycosyltransferase [Paenibacillus validus]
MLRVAYLDHTARWSGGEIALYNLLTNLDQEIEPLVILAEEGLLADKLLEKGVDVRIHKLREKTRNRNRNKIDFQMFFSIFEFFQYGLKLGKLLRKENVACIHTNSLKSAIYGAIAAKSANLPLVWHIRDNIAAPYLRPTIAKFIRLMARLLPNGIIANSNSTMASLHLSSYRDIHTLVAYSSYNGPIAKGTDAEWNKKQFIVLLVGRLDEWKGQHILLEAAARFKNNSEIQFWIAGDAIFGNDEYKLRLDKQIKDNDLTNVSMLGHVDHIPALLQKADLLVHTSIMPEPFGQVIVEGMASGLPVIASDLGGPREIVLRDVTGLLIPPGDAEILRDAIQWMIDHPEERARMGEKAISRVRENFLIDSTVKRISEFYPNVVKQKAQ